MAFASAQSITLIKSQLLVFEASNKALATVPTVYLCDAPLQRVVRFKYLGH